MDGFLTNSRKKIELHTSELLKKCFKKVHFLSIMNRVFVGNVELRITAHVHHCALTHDPGPIDKIIY